LNRAIKLNPEDAIAYGDRALAWIKWGDYDQAIADRNEAIKLAPGIPRDSSPDL
jgi:Flp pilus assembly protein TadD